MAVKLESSGCDHMLNDVVALDGSFIVSFICHSYTNPPKLQAKQLKVAVLPGRITVLSGVLIIFGQGTVLVYTSSFQWVKFPTKILPVTFKLTKEEFTPPALLLATQ